MAVNTTILTSPARVKTDTPLNDSVDDNLLYPAIVTAQERNCHPLLGTDLFNKLKTLISAGEVGDPGNESYETLLNVYLVPMLVQYTFAEVLPVLRLRFLNNSVVAMGSEQSTTASYDELKPIMNSANEIGNFYKAGFVSQLLDGNAAVAEYSFFSIKKGYFALTGPGVSIARIQGYVTCLWSQSADVYGFFVFRASKHRQFDGLTIR